MWQTIMSIADGVGIIGTVAGVSTMLAAKNPPTANVAGIIAAVGVVALIIGAVLQLILAFVVVQ